MRRHSSNGTSVRRMVLASTSMVPAAASQTTLAPRWRSVSTETFTSSMAGRFSITQGVRLNMAAGMITTAVFLPPLTRTLPSSRRPPVMSILSSAMRALLRLRVNSDMPTHILYTMMENLARRAGIWKKAVMGIWKKAAEAG